MKILSGFLDEKFGVARSDRDSKQSTAFEFHEVSGRRKNSSTAVFLPPKVKGVTSLEAIRSDNRVRSFARC